MSRPALKCPECGSTELQRYGYHVTRHGKKQRWKCTRCGRNVYTPV